MPLYEIEHSVALGDFQKDTLAKRITNIHSRLFTTPSLFVNIRFLDKSGSGDFTFVGGKRVGFQRFLRFALRCFALQGVLPDTFLQETKVFYCIVFFNKIAQSMWLRIHDAFFDD